MRHILPFFKEEELIEQDLPLQTCLEMKFQDKQLVRCLDFAKHHRQHAIDVCQEDIAAGIFCVLTESDTHFTVWREQLSEGQNVSDGATPTLQPLLNPSQPSYSKEKNIPSSQLEEFESVYVTSPPVTSVKHVDHLAANPGSHTLETPVELLDTSSQSATFRHNPTLAAATTRISKSPTHASNTSPTPRSAFLTLFNQELAQHIGPIADFMINELLAKQPKIQPQQLIEAIVAEIPDPQEAQNIQKSLEPIIHQFKGML